MEDQSNMTGGGSVALIEQVRYFQQTSMSGQQENTAI